MYACMYVCMCMHVDSYVCCVVLYCIILYCIVLFRTCTVLYCTVLYARIKNVCVHGRMHACMIVLSLVLYWNGLCCIVCMDV